MEKMLDSGIKKEDKAYGQITGIIRRIYDFEKSDFDNIYQDFGLNVLWYDKHEEVHDFVIEILN